MSRGAFLLCERFCQIVLRSDLHVFCYSLEHFVFLSPVQNLRIEILGKIE